MIAKDFQIGDWANLTYTKRNGTVVSKNFKISQLRSPYKGQPIDVWSEEGNMGHEDVSPIVLTPEILRANKWEYRFDGLWYYDFDNTVLGFALNYNYYRKSWEVYCNLVYTEIRYVHELQHCIHQMGRDDLADNIQI